MSTRNLIVCCDGTWNDPDELRGKVAAPTNVVKLALALESDIEVALDERAQLVHYVPGVGTAAGDRLAGGAFGVGISENIRDGYRFLVTNYLPGDRVFLFGFSRGAYTARSLAGLIHNCGILREECVGQLDAAYAFYRDRTNATHPDAVASQMFRREYSHTDSSVYFIGVWDTVGALGIPEGLPGWKELSTAVPGWERLWGFHDTSLGPSVTYAYHALAIDEERPPYAPTLWTSAPQNGQTLEQVWFAGVHSEVGGGSADASLSDIALLWMAEKAADAGGIFRRDWRSTEPPGVTLALPAPDYAGPLNQSRHGVWEVLHPLHRLQVSTIEQAPCQWVASSAERRADEKTGGYRPRGLEAYIQQHGTVQTEPEG